MFKTIVVGVDGTGGSEDALALAGALASESTRLIAVHAFPYELHPSRGSVGGFEETLREESERQLAGWVTDPRFERLVVADISAGHALHHVAEAESAQLIVVGASHRGRAGRVLLGDVSRATMHGARCAVAIAPHGHRDHVRPVSTIGVGYDDRPQSRAALELAAALAAEIGAHLRVVYAVPLQPMVVGAQAYAVDWDAVHEGNLRFARTTLQDAVAGLPVTAATDTPAESAGAALIGLSEEVELLVVGSRGWGAFRSILLGSTADKLAHEAACPLIVVPSPAAE